MIHWRFGGSTAQRTLSCPGWRQAADGVPKGAPSVYATEGTALHQMMEHALMLDDREGALWTFLDTDVLVEGDTPELVRITEEHVLRAVEALRAFEQLEAEHGLYEYEVEVGAEYEHDTGGHADVIGCTKDSKTVFVVDFKFGIGVNVFPEDNAQGLFYAMVCRRGSSADDMFMGAEALKIVIIQPNDRGLPVLRVWETDIPRVDRFEREFNAALALARGENPPMAAGGHCRFCPVSPVCDVRLGQAHRALLMDPAQVDTLEEALALLPQLRQWITDVEQAALTQLERGQTIPGHKLVAKRAIRQWAVPDEVVYRRLARKLGGKKLMRQQKLLSPAGIEKLAKAKGVDIGDAMADMVVAQSSGFTVTHEDDARPEMPSPAGLAEALRTAGGDPAA